ncbi:MAG: hypothetical protein IKZ38_02490 [Clostridia bacterium]|nr:hypothetical protein [Clostridia bacterium]
MTEKTKSATFIGFAVRSGNYRIGGNSLATIKGAYLIIVCKSASENTVKLAKKYSSKFHCPLLKTVTNTLEELTFKSNAKVMAILDRSLAKAITENAKEDFISEV